MEAATDFLDALSENDLLRAEELAKKCLIEGATLADVRGYTQDELEAVYHFAHNAYQQRKYEKARQLFQFLAHNDHTDSRFWMGLAACHQMSGSHEQAVTAYAMAAVLDATNPRPALHAGECYLALGDLTNARKAFDAVEFICGLPGATVHSALRKRAAALAAAMDEADPAPGSPAAAPRPQRTTPEQNR